MLGLGETFEEIESTCYDLLAAGCGILSMGQYLQPSESHLVVQRYVPPEEFDDLEEKALTLGVSGGCRRSFCTEFLPGGKILSKSTEEDPHIGGNLRKLSVKDS